MDESTSRMVSGLVFGLAVSLIAFISLLSDWGQAFFVVLVATLLIGVVLLFARRTRSRGAGLLIGCAPGVLLLAMAVFLYRFSPFSF
ncbi:MAG: hypothetical protein QM779_04105 [Propionicimonas sp.]|uniref:hypothetical protein n=1 Tax=Propionicimonas sp. TaxID=1955623 RepID=UPI003D121E5D